MSYTREELLARFRLYECPAGLQAHTTVYASQPAEPELFHPPANLATAVSTGNPAAKPKRSISELANRPGPRAAAAGAARGADPRCRGDTPKKAGGLWPEPTSPFNRFTSLENWKRGGPLPRTTSSDRESYIDCTPIPDDDLDALRKSIIRWSDGRALFMVAHKEMLPIAEKCAGKLSITRKASQNVEAAQKRNFMEQYEAQIADIYSEFVRHKKLRLPEPTCRALRLTPETSVALWPTFRELYLKTEDILQELGAWETSLQNNDPPSARAALAWEYLDPQDNIQGPFPSEKMTEWFQGEYFPPTLPVRIRGYPHFVPLMELYPLDRCTQYVPFLNPPPSLDRMKGIVHNEIMQQPPPVVEPPKPPTNAEELTRRRQEQEAADLIRKHETEMAKRMEAQREAQRLEAQRRHQEEIERVAEMLREQQRQDMLEQQRKEQQARKQKEQREAKLLAEKAAIEEATSATLAPAPAKWRQPTVIDDTEAGPSIEESRRLPPTAVTKAAAPVASEWSKRVKGKKADEVVLMPKSAWRIPVRAAVPASDIWSDEPPLEPELKAAPEPVEVPVPAPRRAAPAARAAEPVRAAEVPFAKAPSADARANIKDLCQHYNIELDPDFITMLTGMPDVDAIKSFLADNLPHMDETRVAHFAEAFWDVVRNPFVPVAGRKAHQARRK